MPAGFADDIGFAPLGDIGLADDPEGEAQNAGDARVPIGRTEEPEEIGAKRIGGAQELAVLVPILGVAMVGEMLDLVEIARIEE